MKRKSKFVIPAKYLLLILTGICVAAMLISFTLNISGGPLHAAAGYVFIPMQEGINKVGTWLSVGTAIMNSAPLNFPFTCFSKNS